MNPNAFASLPAVLRAAADAVAALPDPATLPMLAGIDMKWHPHTGGVKLTAQLASAPPNDDGQIITDLNRWAATLGGSLYLGEEVRMHAAHGYYWRRLAATATLPDGTVIEVWDHLQYPVPAADLIPA